MKNQGMENALVSQIEAAFGGMGNTITNIGFDGLGKNTVDGYVQGIENRLPNVHAVGQNTGKTYRDALKASLEQNSPSRVTERIGAGAVDGYVKGAKNTLPQVENIAKTLALAFIDGVANKITMNHDIDNATRRQVEDTRRTADTAVMNANFEAVGMEMANGVARGIDSGSGIVSNAAAFMINNALSTMRNEAQISSPSRRTIELADQLGNGLIIGLKAKGKELAEVCKNITAKVIDNLHIDPSELITNAQDVLRSIQSALPTLESNIRYVTNPQASAASAATIRQASGTRPHAAADGPPTYNITINVEEISREIDIDYIAREIGRRTDREIRRGGVVFV